MRNIIIPFLCVLLSFFGYSQKIDPLKKQLKASRIDTDIKIDGVLDEAAWADAAIATDFITLDPTPNLSPEQKTKVRVLYDNSAIYVGAYMIEVSSDSVMVELAQRDNFGNADWFGIFLNPYGDGINGVSFLISATGGQFDAVYSTRGEDSSWDAVWDNAVTITDDGWYAELKIPYSAIRFPDQKEQVWGLNFGRMQRRTGVKSFWSKIDPKVDGFLNQFGQLSNIQNIKSPLRLSATPYLSGYVENFRDKNADPKNSTGYSYSAGMDVKYGISDAFTLDMTLIPDFGQVQSDDQVLNLSPFEVRFNENRPFFTEGTELFDKFSFNNGNMFYSRRIGGRPIGYWDVETNDNEEITENPQETQLYNATKISGRTTKGLGIGLLNAVGAEMEATIENTVTGEERTVRTAPLTNYNVLVFDQNLKNNSYITFMNTNVWRSGSEYYDSNVSGTTFKLRNKKNSYAISGTAALSQEYFSNEQDQYGYTYNISLEKTSGLFNWEIEYIEMDDKFNPNDFGFLNRANRREIGFFANRQFTKPFWSFNRANVWAGVSYNRLHTPNTFTEVEMNIGFWAQTKSQWNINAWVFAKPTNNYDYFEPRYDGRYFIVPAFINTGFWVGSDRRKKLSVGLNANVYNVNEKGRHGFNWSITPRYRFSNKFNMSWNFRGNKNFVDTGFVDFDESDNSIFGRRTLTGITNIVNANYIFTPQMSLTFRLRHNWTKVVNNDSFYLLEEDGTLGNTDFTGNYDWNFNAFNIDMVYSWRFAPGSDIFIVWKNAILDYGDDASINYGDLRYFDNIKGLFDLPQTNSLSIRVVYYLDYLNLKKKK